MAADPGVGATTSPIEEVPLRLQEQLESTSPEPRGDREQSTRLAEVRN